MLSRRQTIISLLASLPVSKALAGAAFFTQDAGTTLVSPRPLSIATDTFPHSLCVGNGSDAGSIIVSCGQGVTGLKIDPKTGSVLRRASIGVYPGHNTLGVCSAFDLAWFADLPANQVAVVNFAPATPTIARMATGANPRDCCRIGSYIAVTESAAPSVTAYDPVTLLPVSGKSVSFPSGSMPYRMRYDGARYLYLTDQLLNKLYEIDTLASPWAITGTWATGTNPWAIDIGAVSLFVTNVNGNSVTVISRAGRTVSATWALSSGDAPHDVRVLQDPNGNEVVMVCCASSGLLRGLDAATGAVLRNFPVASDNAVMDYDVTGGGWLYNTNAIANTITANRIESALPG